MIYVYAKSAKAIDISDENVFSNYQTLLERLSESDVVYIKNLSSLGRNYNEIIKHWRTITKIKNAHIAVIDNPMLDTRLGNGIADAVLETLLFAAKKNPKPKRKQDEPETGILGKPQKQLPRNFDEACTLVENAQCNYTEGAWLCYMPVQSFKNAYREHFDGTCVEVRQETLDRLNERRAIVRTPNYMPKTKEIKETEKYSNAEWIKAGASCYHIVKGKGVIVSLDKSNGKLTARFGANEQVFPFPKIVSLGLLTEAK